ncbi:glycosyltransferase family 2 protein [Fortiea contorta]|uniref:glycosyltransferase family 2 protein n=1 Tax=Fortiea contorta TaxID=1892405 RepID=UPI00034D0D83|nr:glycosyltransferase family 2 protein [Fortiea contorta]
MNIKHLAVLMTCHNRREKTLTCLQQLSQQNLPANVKIQVYLVDDYSTDGTREAVISAYPDIKVIQGNGNLFWNGGMRLAFAEAIQLNYDYYLWLNDDTLLYSEAVNTLLTTSDNLKSLGHHQAIVVGSTQDPETGVLTYGGMVRDSWWHPLKFSLVQPDVEAKPCLTMNGNCVLIHREVVQSIGNLDATFTHNTGDIDYGLRAQKHNCSIWIVPGYVGTCENNVSGLKIWEQTNKSLREQWHQVNQPKGLPLKEWKTFAYRYAGWFWPIYWLLPYARLLMNIKSF